MVCKKIKGFVAVLKQKKKSLDKTDLNSWLFFLAQNLIHKLIFRHMSDFKGKKQINKCFHYCEKGICV